MKYYGSCFSSPESSNAIGILGILGILVCLPPSGGWAFGFDLFPPSVLRYEPKPKTPATCSVLAADLPRPSADGSQRPELRPRFAPLRRRPAPSFGRRQPAATLRYAPLRRIVFNYNTTPVQLQNKTTLKLK